MQFKQETKSNAEIVNRFRTLCLSYYFHFFIDNDYSSLNKRVGYIKILDNKLRFMMQISNTAAIKYMK